MRQFLLKLGAALGAFLVASLVFAQNYNLNPHDQLATPRERLEHYMRMNEQLYSRYGWDVQGRDASARSGRDSFYTTQAGNGCVGCEENPLFRQVDISGGDSRGIHAVDANGEEYVAELDENVILSEDEEEIFSGVAQIVCGSTRSGGAATLIRDNNGELKFVTAAHVVLPEELQLRLRPNIERYSTENLQSILRENANTCRLVVSGPKPGQVLGKFRINTNRMLVGTFSNDPGGDFFSFKIENDDDELIRRMKPIKMKALGSLDAKGTFGRMVAYHYDIKPGPAKIKTEGLVRTLSSVSPFRKRSSLYNKPNIVGHNIDATDGTSGAFIVDASYEAFGFHIEGNIQKGLEANFITDTNLAILFTNEMIAEIDNF